MSEQTIEFQKKVADKVLYAIEGFDPFCIVAGGAPRDWTLGNLATDIDLFFFYRINATEREVHKLLERALGQEVSRLGSKEMTENYTTNPNIKSVWQSIVDGVTIQLIEMSTPTWQVVDSFPLTICKVWYKGGKITPTKEFDKSVKGSYIIKTDKMYANESRYLQKILAKFPDFKYYESYEDFFQNTQGDIDMSKFKVGDKVRVIYTDPEDWYEEGDVGEVVEACPIRVFVVRFADGYIGDAAEEQLELISEDNKNWWETPEGIEWLSTQQDVEEQFLKSQEKKEEKTYQFGQRFVVTCEGTEWDCILAQVGWKEVCFINLKTGNRINDPVRVYNSKKVTGDEMEMIAEGCTFQLL